MSQRTFHLAVMESDWSRYRISGEASLSLPSCACDECGQRWAVTGESYPTVDSATLLREFSELATDVLTADKWQMLRPRLAPWFPRTARLTPGTGAGSFRGFARGKLNDFSWYQPWTVFIRGSAVDALLAGGVKLGKLAEADLRLKKDATVVPGFYEPEAELRTELAWFESKKGSLSRCEKCGRYTGRTVEMRLADPSEIPTDVDIWRAANWPARYLVSERFASTVEELGLTGWLLKPLED